MGGAISNRKYYLDREVGFFLIPFLRLKQKCHLKGSSENLTTQTASA